MRHHTAILSGAVMTLATVVRVSGDAPFFTGLGDLPGGPRASTAAGISADGSVVAGTSAIDPGACPLQGCFEAFRWTAAAGVIGIGTREATAISADGRAIVGRGVSIGSSELHAYRWTEGGGALGLNALALFTHAVATGVSADGSVVVGTGASEPPCLPGVPLNPEPRQAFVWTETAGVVLLGTLPGDQNSFASAVSADGAIVVGHSTRFNCGPCGGWCWGYGHYEAFRLDRGSGVMIGLGYLPGAEYSVAHGISPDGMAIVGESGRFGLYENPTAPQAFLWTPTAGMVGLGVPPGADSSVARGVSADGTVVVGCSSSQAGSEAFIWDGTHAMRSLRDVLIDEHGLQLSGWLLTEATGVSADGATIVGSGINPSGDVEAWIAHLGHPGVLGDINGDGVVDVLDLLELLLAWGGCGACHRCPADLNGDCTVDVLDLLELLSNWS